MTNHEKFLQLLRSPDEANVLLALELAKGVPELGRYLTDYLVLYRCLFDKRLKKNLRAKHIAKLNETKIERTQGNLESLPPQLGRLKQLEFLYLRSNKLIGLPGEIGQLVNLDNLYLGNNRPSTGISLQLMPENSRKFATFFANAKSRCPDKK